jgi:hypothetical protein
LVKLVFFAMEFDTKSKEYKVKKSMQGMITRFKIEMIFFK